MSSENLKRSRRKREGTDRAATQVDSARRLSTSLLVIVDEDLVESCRISRSSCRVGCSREGFPVAGVLEHGEGSGRNRKVERRLGNPEIVVAPFCELDPNHDTVFHKSSHLEWNLFISQIVSKR